YWSSFLISKLRRMISGRVPSTVITFIAAVRPQTRLLQPLAGDSSENCRACRTASPHPRGCTPPSVRQPRHALPALREGSTESHSGVRVPPFDDTPPQKRESHEPFHPDEFRLYLCE